MDGLTRLKHNVCGPGLCETRMHAYGRSLRALTEREATTHDHEREPVWSRWSLQPGRRDQPPRKRATLLMLLHSRDLPFTTTRGTVRLASKLLLGLLAWMVMLRLLPGKSTVPVPVNNVPGTRRQAACVSNAAFTSGPRSHPRRRNTAPALSSNALVYYLMSTPFHCAGVR